MSQNLNNDILTKSPMKLFGRYFISSILSVLTTSLLIMIDTMFIGQGIGEIGLSALNLSLPVFAIYFSLGGLLGSGGATVYSVCRGAKQDNDANQYFTLSMLLGIAIIVPITIFAVLNIDGIANFLGASDVTRKDLTDYLQVILLCGGVYFLQSILNFFLRNDGAPGLTMISAFVACIFNIVGDYVGIYVLGWGMRGAAIATIFATFMSAVVMLIHFFRKRNNLRFTAIDFEVVSIWRVIKNGLSVFVLEVNNGVVAFVFNMRLLQLVGEIGVTAYSVIANTVIIAFCFFNGTAQAIQPLISINYGANNMDRVRMFRKIGLVTAEILAVIGTIIGFLIPDKLVYLFIAEPSQELMSMAIPGVMIYFSGFVFSSANIILAAYYQAIESFKFSTTITLLRGIVFLVIGLYLLSAIFHVNGVWGCFMFAELLTLIFIWVAKRKRKGTAF